MTDEQKTSQLLELIDKLCDPNFRKNNSLVDSWIKKLCDIYTDNYRHSYSDIFFKVQEIISEKSDSEILEILGENLNFLRDRIYELCNGEENSNDYGKNLSGYKKFADHIKLEIGRYNFIKLRFENVQKANTGLASQNDSKSFNDVSKEVQDLKRDIDKIRPVVTSAKKGLDGIDDKLESNKISSITALTIFSAVILAFSGGITFETGVLKDMAEPTPYRLVFIVALSGFILFNTIFALLYLVGKMTGKKISTRCKHISIDENETNKCCGSCGDGYCKKKYHNVNIFCRLAHKYSYVLLINLILIYVLYSDFFLWICKGDIKSKCFVSSQAALILLLAIFCLIHLLYIRTKRKWTKYDYKVRIFQKIVLPDKPDGISTIVTKFQKGFAASLGIVQEDLKSEFIKEIKDMEFKKAFKHLEHFSSEQMMKRNNVQYANISYEEHRNNKKRMRKLKALFKKDFSSIKESIQTD